MTLSNLLFVAEMLGIPIMIAWGVFARKRGYSENAFWLGAIIGTLVLAGFGAGSVLAR